MPRRVTHGTSVIGTSETSEKRAPPRRQVLRLDVARIRFSDTIGRMTDELVRFGVAMDRSLLEDFDTIVEARGVTRSEVLRDLVRAEVVRARVSRGVPAVATLTLVYDHHVRELTERLTDFQHKLGDQVRSSLHVHLDEHRCLEVIVMRGRSDVLQRAAEKLLATRGVTHGGLEIIADETHAHAAAPAVFRRIRPGQRH